MDDKLQKYKKDQEEYIEFVKFTDLFLRIRMAILTLIKMRDVSALSQY